MAKFNLKLRRNRTDAEFETDEIRTAEGARGFVREPRSELFLLGVSNMVGEDTYYEAAADRDERFRALIAEVAVTDPQWFARFVPWLRTGALLRSASVVAALEGARAQVAAGVPGSRSIVDSALQRADEPGGALAYWLRRYGRALPKPVKRGVADAAVRLYHERSLLKYDADGAAVRFGDVVDLTHPAAKDERQGDLFRHALDRRHKRDNATPDSLGVRNLRNFDQTGVSDAVAESVAAKLSDPDEVARSRALPMRFLSAFNATANLRWAYPLEKALQQALANVAALDARTLILIDTSGSMNSTFSRDGTLRAWQAATVFGLALAARAKDATVVSFSDVPREFPAVAGESVLASVRRFRDGGYFQGGATRTEQAVRASYRRHDRVVILTDEQAHWHGRADVAAAVPPDIPVYTWNLVGYRVAHATQALNRYNFGGLSDAAFSMIPLIEAGSRAQWPF